MRDSIEKEWERKEFGGIGGCRIVRAEEVSILYGILLYLRECTPETCTRVGNGGTLT